MPDHDPPTWEAALGLTGEDAAAVAEVREGIERRWREMPDTVRALPPKLRAAWLVGDIQWSGKHLKDIEPVVTTKPGMSVSDLVIRQRGGAEAELELERAARQAAETERARLREAFFRFGDHQYNCQKSTANPLCTCGFTETWKRLHAALKKEGAPDAD